MDRCHRMGHVAALGVIAMSAVPFRCEAQPTTAPTIPWAIHDTARAQPPIVDAGPSALSSSVPSDAIVLFAGRDALEWRSEDRTPVRWKVENGYLEVVGRTGGISTVREFGDCQLHIEWATPSPASGAGQDRGNSGVFLMGRYEVQVLDSYRNPTYPDGQAGAIYGQYPPLVNASRAPGEWQSYDIIFKRPRFDERGALAQPARITVFHNGVLIHDATVLTGPTAHRRRPPYAAHAARLPIGLQDHDSPVRFRNIWVRDLER